MATLTDLFMHEAAGQWDHSNIRLGLAKLEGSADEDMEWSDINLIAATGSYDLDIQVQNG